MYNRQIVSNIYNKSAAATENTLESSLLMFVVMGLPIPIDLRHIVVYLINGDEKDNPTLMRQEPVLKLWTKESNRKFDYNIAHSELIVKAADDYVAFVSEEIPEVNKEALKALLIVNLEKYYRFE